jgi:hypothetical protein
MSDPFPNELVILAWKARVGYSLERCRTQAACWYGQHEFTFIQMVKS